MKISVIPAFVDNYFYALHHPSAAQVAVVDPGDVLPVVTFLKENGLTLSAILVTHHHADHIGGILELQKQFPEVVIYGYAHDSRLPFLTRKLEDKETFSLWGRCFTLFATPGHTTGHIVYACEAPGSDASQPTQSDAGESTESNHSIDIFCGDTLFGAGCGGLFGGTMEQLFESVKFLRSFPNNTRLWCAHEYTEKNLWVATQIEPTHAPTAKRLESVKAMRQRNEKTVPLILEVEKQTNPFLRFDDPHLKEVTNTKTDLETFAAVRHFRDRF